MQHCGIGFTRLQRYLIVISCLILLAFSPDSKAELIYKVGDYYVYVKGKIVVNGRFQTESEAIARAARASLDCKCLSLIQRAVFTDREILEAVAVEYSWDAPTQREDGSALPLNEISGYTIEYGFSAGALTNTVNVSGGSTLTHTITDISGQSVIYARIATVDSDGQQGNFSSTINTSLEL